MKKYIYCLGLAGAIIYSCKTQSTPSVPVSSQTPATPEAPALVSNADILKKGEDLYNLRCGKCHGLPAPSEYSVDDWKPIMEAMAPKAKLNAEETNWVLAYVSANSKK